MKNLIISKYSLLKTILISLILLLPCSYFAQNYQIIYEVKFKPIKENDDYLKEYMVLKTIKGQSSFYNLNKEKIDSLVDKNNFKALSSITSSLLRLKVSKNLAKDYSNIGVTFNQFNYWYKEKDLQYYNLKKYDIYKDYTTTEAFTNFGKRKWHVLYTSDIPITAGPYVFSGLPGLVIKAESTDGDYMFEVIEVKKINDTPLFTEKKENIKKEKLMKNIDDFIKDPASHRINFKNDIGDSFIYEFNGARDESYNSANESIKNILQKFNNYPDKDIPLITF